MTSLCSSRFFTMRYVVREKEAGAYIVEVIQMYSLDSTKIDSRRSMPSASGLSRMISMYCRFVCSRIDFENVIVYTVDNFTLRLPAGASKEIRALLQKLMAQEPQDRLTCGRENVQYHTNLSLNDHHRDLTILKQKIGQYLVDHFQVPM